MKTVSVPQALTDTNICCEWELSLFELFLFVFIFCSLLKQKSSTPLIDKIPKQREAQDLFLIEEKCGQTCMFAMIPHPPLTALEPYSNP